MIDTSSTNADSAPWPTAFNTLGEAIGPRLLGNAAGDVYQYEGSGVFRQNQVITSVNAKVNSKFTLSLHGG